MNNVESNIWEMFFINTSFWFQTSESVASYLGWPPSWAREQDTEESNNHHVTVLKKQQRPVKDTSQILNHTLHATKSVWVHTRTQIVKTPQKCSHAYLYTELFLLTAMKNRIYHTFKVAFYLRGPQRVRPKKPRREMTQLNTACFSNFIHYKKNRFNNYSHEEIPFYFYKVQP